MELLTIKSLQNILTVNDYNVRMQYKNVDVQAILLKGKIVSDILSVAHDIQSEEDIIFDSCEFEKEVRI